MPESGPGGFRIYVFNAAGRKSEVTDPEARPMSKSEATHDAAMISLAMDELFILGQVTVENSRGETVWKITTSSPVSSRPVSQPTVTGLRARRRPGDIPVISHVRRRPRKSVVDRFGHRIRVKEWPSEAGMATLRRHYKRKHPIAWRLSVMKGVRTRRRRREEAS